MLSEASGASSDGVPLGSRRVDAEVHASGLETVHHPTDEIDVRLLVTGPVLCIKIHKNRINFKKSLLRTHISSFNVQP